jgi:hypothetical protein
LIFEKCPISGHIDLCIECQHVKIDEATMRCIAVVYAAKEKKSKKVNIVIVGNACNITNEVIECNSNPALERTQLIILKKLLQNYMNILAEKNYSNTG